MSTLHIYAQAQWHDPAFIVGDRAALERLRDALQQALEKGYARPQAMTTDGEGYVVHVVCVSPEVMESTSLPYTDRSLVGLPDGERPYELIPVRCETCNRPFNGEGELETRCGACQRRLDVEPR